MRLGRLILQICALLMALTLVYLGYVYLESRKLSRFATLIEYPTGNTPAERIARFADAPDMSCTFTVASFEGAVSGKVYISASKLRYDVVEASTRRVLHTLFDGSGLYIWDDDSEFVAFLPPDTIYVEHKADAPVFSLECTKWRYNKGAFELPLGKPVKNSQTLKVI